MTNTLALINMLREKNVATVRTPNGIIFMGLNRLTTSQREGLLAIPQKELDAAMRWQK